VDRDVADHWTLTPVREAEGVSSSRMSAPDPVIVNESSAPFALPAAQ